MGLGLGLGLELGLGLGLGLEHLADGAAQRGTRTQEDEDLGVPSFDGNL